MPSGSISDATSAEIGGRPQFNGRPVIEKRGGRFIPTVILAAPCLQKLVGMALDNMVHLRNKRLAESHVES